MCIYKKYSTNSGCAIGTSLNDALIHALNELLERYSLSKHYYNVFIDHSEKAVFINPKSLSASLLELYNTISAEIGTEIIIVDIKTFDGFFVIKFLQTILEQEYLLKGADYQRLQDMLLNEHCWNAFKVITYSVHRIKLRM